MKDPLQNPFIIEPFSQTPQLEYRFFSRVIEVNLFWVRLVHLDNWALAQSNHQNYVFHTPLWRNSFKWSNIQASSSFHYQGCSFELQLYVKRYPPDKIIRHIQEDFGMITHEMASMRWKNFYLYLLNIFELWRKQISVGHHWINCHFLSLESHFLMLTRTPNPSRNLIP